MNERISKLYSQSIIIEDGGDYVCGELDPVKFAELIVQECMAIAREEEGHSPFEGPVETKIKQHFGVE